MGENEKTKVVAKKAMRRTASIDEPVKEIASKRAMKRTAGVKGKGTSMKATVGGKFAKRVRKGILAKRPAAAEEEEEVDESEEEAEGEVTVTKKTMKRPAAAADEQVAKKGKK